jgi:class 3 adenylate cyclase
VGRQLPAVPQRRKGLRGHLRLRPAGCAAQPVPSRLPGLRTATGSPLATPPSLTTPRPHDLTTPRPPSSRRLPRTAARCRVAGHTHEDNPTRGVRAALELAATVRGSGHRVSVGVTTGDLLCTCVGARKLRSEYTVFGDAINLSARLMVKCKKDPSMGEVGRGVDGQGRCLWCSLRSPGRGSSTHGLAALLAQQWVVPRRSPRRRLTAAMTRVRPPQILCDEATYLRAKYQASFTALEPLPVKGKAQPVLVYRCGPASRGRPRCASSCKTFLRSPTDPSVLEGPGRWWEGTLAHHLTGLLAPGAECVRTTPARRLRRRSSGARPRRCGGAARPAANAAPCARCCHVAAPLDALADQRQVAGRPHARRCLLPVGGCCSQVSSGERPLIGRDVEMTTVLNQAAAMIGEQAPGGVVVVEGNTGESRAAERGLVCGIGRAGRGRLSRVSAAVPAAARRHGQDQAAHGDSQEPGAHQHRHRLHLRPARLPHPGAARALLGDGRSGAERA